MMRTVTYVFLAVALVACSQSSKAGRRVYAQIEADEIDVASRVPSRVKRIAVRLGQKVKAGDVLVEFIDDVIAAKRGQAEAVMAAARSRVAIANDAVRSEEKDQLKSAVEAARRQMEFAKSSLERAKTAHAEGAISKQQLDEIDFKYGAAREQHRAALAKQRMANSGARPEEKEGAQALFNQAQSAVAEAEAYGKDIQLTAPVDGEVSQILCHEGELVPTGYPAVTLLKVAQPWIVFQVPETQLKEFPMGQKVTIAVPALDGKKLVGEVTFIAPMAGFANRVTTQDRGTFDLKTFEVRASLPVVPDAPVRPGMTALVTAGG